jgi:hypothetical protein
MLSQVMLAKIELRCQQAKNNNTSFGSMSVILIGDPAQLLPVCASSLYDLRLNSTMAIGGYTAYQKFTTVITLEALMRQENPLNDQRQAQFISLLPRLRNGTSTIEDFKLLESRYPNQKNSVGFENAISIFNDNESVDKCNYENLKQVKNPICELLAINTSLKGRATSSQQFGGLVNSLYLAIDCQIVLTSNIWKKTGNFFCIYAIIKLKI